MASDRETFRVGGADAAITPHPLEAYSFSPPSPSRGEGHDNYCFEMPA